MTQKRESARCQSGGEEAGVEAGTAEAVLSLFTAFNTCGALETQFHFRAAIGRGVAQPG